jgi:hypothetical protein
MRVIVFVLFPLIAILFSQFLRRTCWLQNYEIGIATIFVLFLPMYGARIANITFIYSLSLFFFVLGAWMLLSHRPVTRVLAVVPIFLSMFTPSFQFFVVVPIAVLTIKLFQDRDDATRQASIHVSIALLCMSALAHRFALPSLSQSLKIRDGYNSIHAMSLGRAVLYSTALVLPLTRVLIRQKRRNSISRESYLLSVGLATVAAGTFPYLAVGHFADLSSWLLPIIPSASDWDSRHQLLQPFGFALILLAIVLTFGARKQQFILVVMFSSVALNLMTYASYYFDAIKQEVFITEVRRNAQQLAGVSAIAIEDLSEGMNARGRTLRPYEWTEMISRALSRDTPIVVDVMSIQFCKEFAPTHIISVSRSNNFFETLNIKDFGIRLRVARLENCSTGST